MENGNFVLKKNISIAVGTRHELKKMELKLRNLEFRNLELKFPTKQFNPEINLLFIQH